MTKSKKIYLFIRTFSEYGGVERICYRFYNFLKSNNYDVYVVCGENKSNVNEKYIIQTGLWRPGRFLKTLSFFLKAKHILRNLDTEYTFAFGKVSDCKIFRTGGGSHKGYLRTSILGYQKISQKYIKQMKRLVSPVNYLNPWIEKKIFSSDQTKCFVAISSFVAEEIKSEFDLEQSKIKIINNSVDIEKYNPDIKAKYRHSMRGSLNISENNTLVGFSSTNFERKGFDNLLEAMSLLPAGFHLAVAGGRSSKKYKALVESLQLNDRIHFLGKIEDMPWFYAGLDVLAHPSYHDTFANVVSEALAMDIPVVVSKQTGAKDIVIDGENGSILHDLSPSTIAESIKITAQLQNVREKSSCLMTDEDIFTKYLELLHS
ncbi:glycosyltransferase family 4 protein [Flexistipes sp.]|uniref:glycosyltransferase family 4 protein n=1 Tax=Flexistipes sp. TaxID=3088135 RepID=UPI002E221C12|nr:glycosyltransferase family 4 protein [Flexistipes sp.]